MHSAHVSQSAKQHSLYGFKSNIYVAYCALGIWHLCERSITGILHRLAAFLKTGDTYRAYFTPKWPSNTFWPFWLSLRNCTNSAANKPHGKMTVKCDTLHLYWSLTALQNYLLMPHCATQNIPRVPHAVLHKLSHCATLYYTNYPTVSRCTTQVIPLCHAVVHKFSPCATLYYTSYPLCHAVLHKLSPCATLYYTNYPTVS